MKIRFFFLERFQRYGVLKNVQLFGPPCTHVDGNIQDQIFCKSFPLQPSFSSSGLTPRTPRTVYRYFRFCLFSTFLVFGSVRQIKLPRVSFSAHVKIASRIVSHRIVFQYQSLIYFWCLCPSYGQVRRRGFRVVRLPVRAYTYVRTCERHLAEEIFPPPTCRRYLQFCNLPLIIFIVACGRLRSVSDDLHQACFTLFTCWFRAVD